MTDQQRILVVDPDDENRTALGEMLKEGGFEVTLVADADTARDEVREREPDAILLELALGEDSGFALLEALKDNPRTKDVPILVVTSLEGEGELTRAFEAGAEDFVRKPIRAQELLARTRSHLRLREHSLALARKQQDAKAMLELTQALASSLDLREILFTVVRRIAEVVKVDRVSIVLSPAQDQGDVGYVVVASDDEKLSNLKIDLSKYPEIRQVLGTGEPLLIDDATTHPILDGVRDDVPTPFRSMFLLPIVWREQVLGVLFLRAATPGRGVAEREMGFCRIVANATAIALRNARVMQSLRDHTQQVTFARFEAERRLRSLERYADLFESSADGIAVVDADGNLLFANPRAYQLLGYEDGAFTGQKVKMLIHPEDAALAKTIWDGFAEGSFPADVDLRLRRKDGTALIANVAFSSLLSGEGAVLFTFRDVTQARQMESELVQTKEFLESLIHASPDGIVAANMQGTIILFNEGAERIYGYPATDVIGKMNVKDLYPEGIAQDVMTMMRSPQHGGEGRIEQIRLDALNETGERVPIALSAALIYEGDEPVATFGIFTDLRERLRVEERLAQAQEKLAVSEKQALIAELAGTAAHELNQPLTSVMGYAELLKRKLDREGAEHRAAEIIVRESERMADIVRKIGKITKYETKSYVGEQKILDLDKASGSADSDRSSEPARE
jgi:PAS domain S-box-containing protein